ncbi:orotidine-5'-phosphate decarboxylase [Cryptosporangium arvum]|uniref:Orotidine 5'-phosphate decarboxylase n=1 Tax=Cryptosporangium arvum DSM 44712 TaxID=927661 RepID=A0A010Z1P4_9ACTN|nr:orotidine-5'-phosphate decarboxylase [Cryptosporangium arvum]EXG81338.1 orotidine-5'-phosphate decarboxylase [Cryptosporangium arvum DSM 44712]
MTVNTAAAPQVAPTTDHFGARLARAVADRGPLCVGVDPHPGLLDAWGLTRDVAGVERFARTVVEALADRVAVLKPQSAFFEQYGSRGVAVLEHVIADARAAGALVLNDVKRGDIGSTVEAYAAAYLDPASPLCGDAMTASPYLGFGSLAPLIDTAVANGNGVFVLGLTSNPEGPQVQHAVAADGRTVAQTVLDSVAAANAGCVPEADGAPYGPVGVVVGATVGETGHDLSRVGGPFLAPGLGAQGAGAEDLRAVFGDARRAVLPSVSREVLRAGPKHSALRSAASRAADDFAAVLA